MTGRELEEPGEERVEGRLPVKEPDDRKVIDTSDGSELGTMSGANSRELDDNVEESVNE
jgi:hypothetical protein